LGKTLFKKSANEVGVAKTYLLGKGRAKKPTFWEKVGPKNLPFGKRFKCKRSSTDRAKKHFFILNDISIKFSKKTLFS
jgi:hypothetical protein